MRVVSRPTRRLARAAYVVVDVTSASHAFPTTQMFFGFSSAQDLSFDESAAPFVPGLLILAAKLGEDLHVAGPLPAGLVDGANAAGEMLHGWWGWRAPRVTSDGCLEPTDAASGVGLFFSRGIDSWSVLLTRLAEDSREEMPTHLLALDAEPVLPTLAVEDLLGGVDHVGEELGIPTVRVATDIRDVLDRFTDWGRETHGAVLAGAALLLRPVLGRAVISASQWVGDAERLGSHPDLDVLWSTPALAIEHADAGRRRWERVEVVARSVLALSTLQVCFRTTEPTNCGRCEKCLRTMTSLHVAGALGRTDRFRAALSVAAVRRVGAIKTFPLADLLDHLDRAGPAVEPLRQAWEEVPAVADDGSPAARTTEVVRRPVHVEGRPSPQAAGHLGPVVLAAGGGRLDHLGTRGGEALVVGWGRGELGLLPTQAESRDAIDRLRGAPDRPEPWCVVDGDVSERLYAAELATDALGPGLLGLDEAGDDAGDEADAGGEELRRRARAAVWWREDGPLDPVAVLASLRAGSVPLQVMPDAAAHRLRTRLPAPVAELVWERSRLADATRVLDALVDAIARWLSHEHQESLLSRHLTARSGPGGVPS